MGLVAMKIRIDPVEAWGWVCTAYTRNSLLAHAWSQLPRPYRVAWVMFIEKLTESLKPFDESELRAAMLKEARRMAEDISPSIQTLRSKLADANAERKKLADQARADRRFYDRKILRLESEAEMLRLRLAECHYKLQEFTGTASLDLIGVRLPRAHSPITEKDVYRRVSTAEEVASLAFEDDEQRRVVLSKLAQTDEQDIDRWPVTPQRRKAK